MSWEDEAKRHLRRVLADRNFTYDELARRLNDEGVAETYATIASKVYRGRFSFMWFLQCMAVMGQRDIQFRIEEPLERERETSPSSAASKSRPSGPTK